MTEELIQTLHPNAQKTNKRISLKKYNFIRLHILDILKNTALTHKELMDELNVRVNEDFEGGVHWYGETIKLDLEARKLVERTNTKPEKYRLTLTGL
jgi:hypothetical protein